MTGLIVPVDVIACCVGVQDAHGPASSSVSFAGATTDFHAQTTGRYPAFLGINVTKSPDDPPQWPLETGVHLHWAMPDALTRADSRSGIMRFPALPNRWLVTRIAGAGQSAKHWIVISDAVSATPPDGTSPPTIPVAGPQATPVAGPQATPVAGPQATPVPEPPAAERGFRYLGAWEVFTPDWSEPRAAGQTLRELAGADLHAVMTGDISFAAFYPSSRSSFGFHDDLADLPAGPAELAYVVTGWYAGSAGDPLGGGMTVPELESALRWTCARDPGSPLTYSLYSGFVQDIAWDANTRYLTDEPEPIAGDVAIGNHPAEALAAYLRGTDEHAALPAVEELLTLYLTGLLPNLATPAPGQLAEVAETLHELQFAGTDGGTSYTITRGTGEATGLPLPLADALNLLNTRQQAADSAAAQARQAKWELFASWYRLFEAGTDNAVAALNAFNRQLALERVVSGRVEPAMRAAQDSKSKVQRMLPGDLTLTQAPAPRYYTAAEPVVLLAGEAAAPAARYGGDGRYHPAGYLACRAAADTLSELTIAGRTTLSARQFTALAPPAAGQLPHQEIAALVLEAALLDTAIGASRSGIPRPALAADLAAWLEGGTGQYYGRPAGLPPSPVAAGRWPGANPWLSLSLLWEAHFHPLLATASEAGPVNYPPGFFTANYRLDPGDPRLIRYAPAADGISVDPAAIDFDPDRWGSGTVRYAGSAVLSPTAADNLRARLSADPATATDPTLQALARRLGHASIAMQGLAGLNEALLTRQAGAQLAIGVSSTADLPYLLATRQITTEITSLTEIPPLAPQFNGSYHAVRAGYLTLSLRVMDPFGRKRPVTIGKLCVADSLAARPALPPAPLPAPVPEPDPVPGVIFAQPRLAQPSRLLFRWLAADSTGYDEMNAHPATTPVCGWLLPDHLNAGFFLYTAQGDPLGSLTLRADGSGITWQAAPGDQATAGAGLAAVMAHQDPRLRDLALALGAGLTSARFRAFWQAVDAAATQIVPARDASQPGLAVLAGRPLALVQASLRLERHGRAALDQTFATLSGGEFTDTDHGVGDVRFPVVLGDLARLDDGLVGYFRHGADGRYDLNVFFSQAASGDDPGVARPTAETVALRAAAATGPGVPPEETRLLMLVDPRAPVHATTGILPTQSLSIPPDQYADVLTGLELAVPAFPLLRGAGGLTVPLPALAGYAWSWVTEEATAPGPTWAVDAELRPVPAGAVWSYSPQALTEGWLRLNPELLRFRLTAAGGGPVVTAGAVMSLDLVITNTRGTPVTFAPGVIGSEMSPPQGSVCYIHFGSLVDPAQIGRMRFSAAGWQFGPLSDERYGSYWAASPAAGPVTLPPGGHLTIAITDVVIAAGTRAQSRVYFDFYNLAGLDDGVDIAVLSVQQPAHPASGR